MTRKQTLKSQIDQAESDAPVATSVNESVPLDLPDDGAEAGEMPRDLNELPQEQSDGPELDLEQLDDSVYAEQRLIDIAGMIAAAVVSSCPWGTAKPAAEVASYAWDVAQAIHEEGVNRQRYVGS